jgi:hypothetical protein
MFDEDANLRCAAWAALHCHNLLSQQLLQQLRSV